MDRVEAAPPFPGVPGPSQRPALRRAPVPSRGVPCEEDELAGVAVPCFPFRPKLPLAAVGRIPFFPAVSQRRPCGKLPRCRAPVRLARAKKTMFSSQWIHFLLDQNIFT